MLVSLLSAQFNYNNRNNDNNNNNNNRKFKIAVLNMHHDEMKLQIFYEDKSNSLRTERSKRIQIH